VLFEGGAGEQIRRRLMADCDVHTLLRLPAGLFYAQGIKANVLFFEKRQSLERRLWVYDLRANKRFTLKTNPLSESDLEDFLNCFNLKNREETSSFWSEDNKHGRWRAYSYDELSLRHQLNWDLAWIKNVDQHVEFSKMSSQELLENMSSDLEDVLIDIRALSEALAK
jgi:type I restriction enzyme M protein